MTLAALLAAARGASAPTPLREQWRCRHPLLIARGDGRPARLRCLPRRQVRLSSLLPPSCSHALGRREVQAGQRVLRRRGCSVGVEAMPAAWRLALGLRLDLNRASSDALRALPRVGAVIARRIVARRRRCGPYASVDELIKVRGIGAATLRRLRPLVRARSARSRRPSPRAASETCR